MILTSTLPLPVTHIAILSLSFVALVSARLLDFLELRFEVLRVASLGLVNQSIDHSHLATW